MENPFETEEVKANEWTTVKIRKEDLEFLKSIDKSPSRAIDRLRNLQLGRKSKIELHDEQIKNILSRLERANI
jgi:hypothetical protein